MRVFLIGLVLLGLSACSGGKLSVSQLSADDGGSDTLLADGRISEDASQCESGIVHFGRCQSKSWVAPGKSCDTSEDCYRYKFGPISCDNGLCFLLPNDEATNANDCRDHSFGYDRCQDSDGIKAGDSCKKPGVGVINKCYYYSNGNKLECLLKSGDSGLYACYRKVDDPATSAELCQYGFGYGRCQSENSIKAGGACDADAANTCYYYSTGHRLECLSNKDGSGTGFGCYRKVDDPATDAELCQYAFGYGRCQNEGLKPAGVACANDAECYFGWGGHPIKCDSICQDPGPKPSLGEP